MSEHQYYEFQAVDRPLSGREMADLRMLSSRATITSTRLVNVYNWGAFRGNPAALMETLFDAFVYTANWGTRQLMLRLPRRLLDLPTATRYCAGDDAQARAAGDYVIVEYLSEQEPDDEVDDDEGWMPALLPLRAELADGDLRGLYLGWLLCAQSGALDDAAARPRHTVGLAAGPGRLPAPQRRSPGRRGGAQSPPRRDAPVATGVGAMARRPRRVRENRAVAAPGGRRRPSPAQRAPATLSRGDKGHGGAGS